MVFASNKSRDKKMKFFGLLATALAAPAAPAVGDGVCFTAFLTLMKKCTDVQVGVISSFYA